MAALSLPPGSRLFPSSKPGANACAGASSCLTSSFIPRRLSRLQRHSSLRSASLSLTETNVLLRSPVPRSALAEPAVAPQDSFVATLLEKISSDDPGDVGSPFSQNLLRGLRDESRQLAQRLRWPGRKDEAFRFTDVKPLQELNIFPSQPQRQLSGIPGLDLSDYTIPGSIRLVTVDGIFQENLATAQADLPAGLVVVPLSQLSEHLAKEVVAPVLGRLVPDADLFSQLNGSAAQDILVIIATEGSSSPPPIHVVHATSAPNDSASVARLVSPRLLVVAQEGAEVELIEEFMGVPSLRAGCYWTNAVAEVYVAKGAKVLHGVVQEQDREAFHVKATAVHQEEQSEYSLIEAQLGARLCRHNLRVKQLGPETQTNISSFSLCGARQVQDLHSSLVLDHPRGVTRQIHKCIVTDSSGQGVFDGNVQVNRFAQQTDAGQLTRSLLLAPRGTVNVKPNLQIVADDVKCTHGAAISDLDEEQMFYFQARGIDEATARSALVFSFAAEIVERFPYSSLKKRLESSLKVSLSSQGAMDSSVAAVLQGSEV